MQNDADLIVDLWSRIKPYITQKERLDVADQIVTVFDEHGLIDGIEGLVDSLDRPLAAAIKSRYSFDSIEEEEDEYEDEYED